MYIVGKYNVYLHSLRHRTEERYLILHLLKTICIFFNNVHILHKALILAQFYVNYALDSLSKYPISIGFYFCLNFLQS